jgi:uncharacterized protein
MFAHCEKAAVRMTFRRVLPQVGTFALLFLIAVTTFAQAPAPSAARAEIEVTIETADPAIRLAGTLVLPNGKGPHPAILLIQGDGPHTRDQLISGSPSFRMIADALTRAGIAVLRVDKRGVGKSTGPSVDDSTIADFAHDAQASFEFLSHRPEIDPERIGLLGHSEGAIVAPIVATSGTHVRFVVLIAPPAVPGGEIWVRQKVRNLKRLGANPAVLAPVEKQMRRLVEFVKSGKNDDATYYQIGHDFVAAHGMEENKITHKFIDQLISDVRNRWHAEFFRYDPAEALKKLKAPTLAVLSSADDQVILDQNLPSLVNALVASGNPDFAVSVLPDHDHFFLTHEGRRLDKHKFGKMEVSADLLNIITPWVERHVRKQARTLPHPDAPNE